MLSDRRLKFAAVKNSHYDCGKLCAKAFRRLKIYAARGIDLRSVSSPLWFATLRACAQVIARKIIFVMQRIFAAIRVGVPPGVVALLARSLS